METKNETPMMKQWRDLKSKHPDRLLLFRCGDFYEAYEEDAKECAKILGITLTTNSKNGYQMAGFPHHALDTYLPKLVRAGKRVAICDMLEDPKLRKTVKRGESENTTDFNSQNKTIMAKKLQAADLIGKTITVVNNEKIKYVVKSADGDKLITDFIMEGREPMPCPVPMSQVQTMVDAGTWRIDGVTATSKTAEDVEDVQDVQPTAQTVDIKPKTEKPKAKKPSKVKGQKSKAESPETKGATLRYSTYTNKKGKTCARISGFSETDAAYVNCADLHGSASYERNKKGEKSFYLVFGPRYADAAKDVCDALNAGKTLAECQAIIDRATEERAKQREEWKQKREEHKASAEAQAEEKSNEKCYTAKDVERVLRKAFGALADALKTDVKDFEPIITASLKMAA